MKTFYHSGKIGDIIYSLPTVKALGGGYFITGLEWSDHIALRPLLASQSYISSVTHITESRMQMNEVIMLDRFRLDLNSSVHLVNQHLRAFGLKDYDWSKGGWLEVENPKHFFPSESYNVITLTNRGRDCFFNWKKEIKRLRKTGRLIFLGDGEVPDFVPYWPTSHLHEAAQIIKGAQEFSSNSTSLFAIRQALGLPYSVEVTPNHDWILTGQPGERILNPHTRKIPKIIRKIYESRRRKKIY